jgi:hypothetical protein
MHLTVSFLPQAIPSSLYLTTHHLSRPCKEHNKVPVERHQYKQQELLGSVHDLHAVYLVEITRKNDDFYKEYRVSKTY